MLAKSLMCIYRPLFRRGERFSLADLSLLGKLSSDRSDLSTLLSLSVNQWRRQIEKSVASLLNKLWFCLIYIRSDLDIWSPVLVIGSTGFAANYLDSNPVENNASGTPLGQLAAGKVSYYNRIFFNLTWRF